MKAASVPVRIPILWIIAAALTAAACLIFALALNPARIDDEANYAHAAQRLKVYDTLAVGMQLQAEEKLDAAEATYRNALELDDTVASSHYLLGGIHLEEENPKEAIAEFDRAIPLQKRNEHVYNSRGVAYFRLDEPEAAERDFTTAMAREPEFSIAQLNRGLLRLREGRDDAALADFDAVIARFETPTAMAAHTGRAIVLARKGDLAGAEQEFTTVVEYALGKERVLDALFNRARAREARGNAGGAQQDRNEYARLEALPETAERFVRPLKGAEEQPTGKAGQQ